MMAGADVSLKVRIYYCLTTHLDTHTLLMRYHTQLMYTSIKKQLQKIEKKQG